MRRMRVFGRILIGAVLVVASVGLAQPAQADTLANFRPGAQWVDTAGNGLQLHGLGIIKVGSTYYGFGENKVNRTSQNSTFQSISCYSSQNLETWTYQGAALSSQGSGYLSSTRLVERPKVLFNAATSTYVMWVHLDDANYSDARVGVATSSTPCGPYTFQSGFQPLGNQSRDIGVFQDDDGSAYLISEDRPVGTHIYKLSSNYQAIDSLVATVERWESPAMFKDNGRYFLLGSQLTGWDLNDNRYTSATSLSGPWASWQDFAPTGSHTYNTQTANVLTIQGSSSTTHVFVGDRWDPNDLGSSLLVWMPLTVSGSSLSLSWTNNWSLNLTTGSWQNGAQASAYVGQASRRCLDVPGGSTGDVPQIAIYDCNGGANQLFNLGADGALRVYGAKCLDVAGGSVADLTPVGTYTCNGGKNQSWVPQANGEIRSVQSGKCLDVSGGSSANGAGLVIKTCAGSAAQKWTAATGPGTTPMSPLSNGNFETGSLSGWSSYGSVVVNGTNPRSGSYAAQVTGSNTGMWQTVSALAPNTKYTMTGWIKAATSGQQAFLYVKNYGNTEVHSATATATAYTQVSVTFTTGSSFTSAEIGLWRESAFGSGVIYLDDATLQ